MDCVGRVPLLVRWPAGLGTPGRSISHMVEAVDVLPSLLQWAGIPVPARLQGRPLPTDDSPAARTRESALLESAEGKSLRTERYRYVARADGRECLFDLNAEFGEYRDVAGDPEQAPALSEMRGRLVQRLLEMERPLPRVWPY